MYLFRLTTQGDYGKAPKGFKRRTRKAKRRCPDTALEVELSLSLCTSKRVYQTQEHGVRRGQSLRTFSPRTPSLQVAQLH